MKIAIILNLYYQPPEMLKNYIKHNKNLYVPINSGNLKGTNDWCDKHLSYETDLKYNIAHLNSKLNEMTAIYAYWKNLMKDDDYIGFNHYRRLFRIEDLNDIAEYDIIDAKPIPNGVQYEFLHTKSNSKLCSYRHKEWICHLP